MAFSQLGTHSPAQVAPRSMAGSKKAGKASQALKPADIVVDINAHPDASALKSTHLQSSVISEATAANGTHPENGAFLETEGQAAAVNGVKHPKARKSRAKANGAAKASPDAATAVKTESTGDVAADLAASMQ